MLFLGGCSSRWHVYVPRAAKVLVPMTRQLVQSLSCIDNLPTDLVAKLLRHRLAVTVCELTCWYYSTGRYRTRYRYRTERIGLQVPEV